MPITKSLNTLSGKIWATVIAIICAVTPASADLVINQMVVELAPSSRTADILVFNNGQERSYVSIEPNEVLNPGTLEEKRVSTPDPRELGLLLSSTRIILEPGQKRLIRVAATSIPENRERVYRVTIKPVTGGVASEASGLKVLVGYEMLVMVKPARGAPVGVDGQRSANTLTLVNRGNSSVELVDGKQCMGKASDCSPLPSKRLYAGARWSQPVSLGGRVEYRALAGGKTHALKF